ncbi:MAG: YdcH family protein [Casimicrobiaceae bacterium]
MNDIGNADRVDLMQRLVALQIEHRDLDDVIRRLSNDPGHDQLQITRMKRRKLMLKDQIARLERQIDPDVCA